jgi:Fe2+ or Zn2+ uptake regulation protein
MNTTIQRRLTANRRAVLETVGELASHPTAAQVFNAVHRRRPRMAVGTVYTALHYLVDRGLIAEVRRPDGVVSYDRNTHPHDHAVCRRCGRLVDVQSAVPSSYAAVEEQTGFMVELHRIEFIGLCPSCRTTPDVERALPPSLVEAAAGS